MIEPLSVPPILYYHRVSPEADPRTGVTPVVFREQMAWLKRLGFSGVPLARAMDPSGSDARHPIVITFDDGYEDNYLHAAPILEEFGFLATIYFVAEKMGGRVEWTRDPVWSGHRLMGVSMARNLVERGFEAGSHTLTHPDLQVLGDTEARREIGESRVRLSEMLSCPVTTFCYPYGSFAGRHLPMVRDSGYTAARTTLRTRPFGKTDPFRLGCRPISGRMGFPRFALTTGLYRLGIRGGGP